MPAADFGEGPAADSRRGSKAAASPSFGALVSALVAEHERQVDQLREDLCSARRQLQSQASCEHAVDTQCRPEDLDESSAGSAADESGAERGSTQQSILLVQEKLEGLSTAEVARSGLSDTRNGDHEAEGCNWQLSNAWAHGAPVAVAPTANPPPPMLLDPKPSNTSSRSNSRNGAKDELPGEGKDYKPRPVVNRRESRERIAWDINEKETTLLESVLDRCARLFRLRRGSERFRLRQMTSLEIATLQKQSLMMRFMASAPVRYVCCGFILANSIFIGLITEQAVHTEMTGEVGNDMWQYVEHAFSVWFLIELLLRFIAEESLFFTGPDMRWNALDSILVALSLFEWIGSMGAPNFTSARLLRFMRFTRIFGVLRVMRACQNFRVMVFAILHSMSSLLWAFVVLSFFKYCYAIIFMHGTAEYLKVQGGAQEETLEAFFGDLYRAWVTLFQAITGGRDWNEIFSAVMAIHWIYGLIFVTYIYLMVFLVLNVVVGTVVKTTSEVYRRDRQHIIDDELNKLNLYTKEIKEFFSDADTDCSGTLSWEEFEAYLRDDKVKAYFQTLDLDISQAHVLFTLLDLDGSDSVSVEEFVDGCVRLKGEAKSIDVNMLLHQVEKLLYKVATFQETCEGNFAKLVGPSGTAPVEDAVSPKSPRSPRSPKIWKHKADASVLDKKPQDARHGDLKLTNLSVVPVPF